ncbi:DsbA family oxidoreductase [Nocardioides sp. YIM 152588]|uniref:DsbA family oxidoreductase n=1 Tax=Nocardioides sp. YIM 152588 TaxID=3158259 RepID=UPI0032E4B65A
MTEPSGSAAGTGKRGAAGVVAPTMRIDIWSDVVCPWCSIGKKRLERALADFEHADDVEVVYHSFLLDPSAPVTPVETSREAIARKYGISLEQAAQAQARVDALAAEEGMTWDQSATPHVSTRDAHRLLHLALAEHGADTQAALKEALLQAYFAEARNVGDHGVLAGIATGVGLDADRVAAVLGSEEYADEVWADIDRAGDLGATGVPFFVVDDRYGISGAQPVELFAQALRQAWAERSPLQVLTPDAGDGVGEACGPEGCSV